MNPTRDLINSLGAVSIADVERIRRVVHQDGSIAAGKVDELSQLRPCGGGSSGVVWRTEEDDVRALDLWIGRVLRGEVCVLRG